MTLIPTFVGPSNVLRSTNMDAERTVNLFLESAAPGTGKAPQMLPRRPPFEPFVNLNAGPVRGLFTQNGRTFGVGNRYLSEIFATHTAQVLGDVGTDGQPVTFAINDANEMAICSANTIHVFDLDTNVLTPIALDFTPAMIAFLDEYIVALVKSSRTFRWSDLNDATTWPGLNVATLSQSSDNIQSLLAVHGQLWLLGTQTSVVWADTGESSAFNPIPGALMEMGCAAPFSAITLDNAVFWLGANEHGNGVVFRGGGVGAAPQRISDFAVEFALAQVPTFQQATAFGFQLEGHSFYCLHVPGLDTTWIYDLSMQTWVEWAQWDPTFVRWRLWRPGNHCFAFGEHLVGDRLSSTVYRLTFDRQTDRVRR